MGVYTTTEKVARFLRADPTLLATKIPDIEDRISRIEDYIDDRLGYSYRTRIVTNEYRTPVRAFEWYGWIVFLRHRHVQSIDKLEVWNGNEYEDWVQTKTEDRNSDWWADYEQGVIFLRLGIGVPLFHALDKMVRVSYRHGKGITDNADVPKDLEDVATKLVVIDILLTEDYEAVLPTGESGIASYSERIEAWRAYCEDWLQRHQEFKVLDVWGG